MFSSHASVPVFLSLCTRSRRKNAQQDEDDDDEDGEENVEEEEEGEEEEDEEEDEDVAGPSDSAKPELTRAERRELKIKKKQAAQKQGIDEDDEDADLINPNHIEKKLNISDLGSRELTRKER